MFNQGFYPTPVGVIEKMTFGLNLNNKRILEPSAGKGNIVDFVNKRWPKNTGIDVIEIEPELQSILYDKKCNVVGGDFLEFKTITEYDAILMNPPFSEGADHLLKAIELAERNVVKTMHISCLLNAQTIKNSYSSSRKKLIKKLEAHNAKIEYMDGSFKKAERKTDVSIALVRMDIQPKTKNFINIDFNNYDKVESVKNEVSLNVKNQEILKRKNEIEVLVNLYHEHSKQLKKAYEEALKLNEYDQHLNSITKDISEFGISSYVKIETKEINDEIQQLRYTYWGMILDTKTFNDKLTEKGKEELRKTILESANLEITMDNVNKLISAMYQNMDIILKKDAVSLFKTFTKHNMKSYSGNIHYYDGWKTNNAFKVNKKVIVPTHERLGGNELMSWQSGKWMDWGMVPEYTKIKQLVNDIVKVFSYFTDYDIPERFERKDNVYENSFLKLQAFKKGTTHITFKDEDALDRFNIFCGIESGMLPDHETVKNNEEARKIYVELFGNKYVDLIK